MKIITYNKLVRDRIPQIIEQSGKTCICEKLSDEQYIAKLNEKLLEEVKEYFESGSVEELADVGEVMHAILAYIGVSIEDFQCLRMKKHNERGGFSKKILLKQVIG